MIVFSIASLITAITSIVLGIFVCLRNSKAPLTRLSFFMCVCIGIWAFGLCMFFNSTEKTGAFFWGYFHNFVATFIPILFLHFTVTFLRENTRRKRILSIGYSIFFMLFLLEVTFPGSFVKDVIPKLSFRYYIVPGVTYYLFSLMYCTFLSYAAFIILNNYRKSTGFFRNQIKYIIIASVFGFGGGATSFPLVFNIPIYPVGIIFVPLYPVIIYYAIVKHRLMDINIIIKKGTIYSILISLIFIPFSLIILFAQKFFFGSTNYMFLFIVFILFGLATLIFPRLKPGTEKTIEQILFRDRYNYKETLSELSKAMISILDKENLLKTIIDTITESMGVEKASILLIDEEKSCYDLQSYRGFAKVKEENFRLALYDPFIIWLRKHKKIIIKEELERDLDKKGLQALVKRLSDMESEICIPLLTRKKMIGICNLGNKRKGDMFSHEDLALLETLSNQAAIAIENAALYEDLKKSEANVRRNERLVALGTLTAGLAHEIRNPLVAIKTFVQLLPERLDDAEFMDHFLKVTSDEVDRICLLVTELLEFSRPSEPNFQDEDINEIAEKMLILVENEARKKGIVINKDYGIGLPFILIDKEQIKQVLLNLFLNAIEATSENGIITFKTRLFNKSNSKNCVRIEIVDNGKGISKDDLEHIFTPFFTTKYSGSGLGLSISYKIIQEHSGFIEVESRVGKGTTFCVDLPISSDKGSVSNGINRGHVNRRESC